MQRVLETPPQQFLARTLDWLRWSIILALALITLRWTSPARTGHPLLYLVLFFAAYNLVVDVLRWRVPRLRSLAWLPVPDLLMAGLVYFLDTDPAGVTFVFLCVALISAAMTLTVRGIIGYTLALVGLVIVVAPTLPGWSPTPENYRVLASRLVTLVTIGVGITLLTRRLMQENEAALASHRRAEETLRQSEATLRLITAQLPAHVWTTDRELRVTSVFGTVLAQLGIDSHPYIGKTLPELTTGQRDPPATGAP